MPLPLLNIASALKASFQKDSSFERSRFCEFAIKIISIGEVNALYLQSIMMIESTKCSAG